MSSVYLVDLRLVCKKWAKKTTPFIVWHGHAPKLGVVKKWRVTFRYPLADYPCPNTTVEVSYDWSTWSWNFWELPSSILRIYNAQPQSISLLQLDSEDFCGLIGQNYHADLDNKGVNVLSMTVEEQKCLLSRQSIFPPNLVHLEFGMDFNVILFASMLPSTLRTLHVDSDYPYRLSHLARQGLQIFRGYKLIASDTVFLDHCADKRLP